MNYGKWNATSGSITGNTADYGGGVHMSGSDTITLGGAVTVTGNKTATDSKNNNLYLVLSTFRVAAADLTDGAKIGVTAPLGATYPIILTDSAVTRNYFVSDDAAYETAIDETRLCGAARQDGADLHRQNPSAHGWAAPAPPRPAARWSRR